MAGASKATKRTLPFKKLAGKANTSNAKPVFSEEIPSQISVSIDEVLGEEIPEDPQAGIDQGIVEYVELDLNEILASNGLSYNLQFPSTYDGNFGTGVQGDNVRLHTQVVNKKNNPKGKAKQDHSGGYSYDLRDGSGGRIPSGSSENWIIDPVACILTSETVISELESSGGTVRAYIYTGDTLSEAISSNLVDIEDDGNLVEPSVSTINFGPGLGAQTSTEGKVTVDASLDNVTTDSISEGDDNLYYTDSRVDTRVNEIRPTGQATFSGDGETKQFSVAHGLNVKPDSWIITPTTDDASSFSHVTANDSNLIITYDTAPPPGTDNLVINWMVSTF